MNTSYDLPRIAFFVEFTLLTLVRLYYKIKAGVFHETLFTKREGAFGILFRTIFGIPMAVSVGIMIFSPESWSWARFSLPNPIRFAGIFSGILSLLSLVWVHQALGDNFTTSIGCKQTHQLVQWGPYRWIRHPMYISYFILFLSGFCMSENWIFGAGGLGTVITLMTIRLSKEECYLLERFGNEYRSFMITTPRFFPRLEILFKFHLVRFLKRNENQ